MIIKIRKYVSKVAEFREKELREIFLNGKRFSTTAVSRLIPHEAKLLESGWRETAYEVDEEKLEMFLKDYGKVLTAENAE